MVFVGLRKLFGVRGITGDSGQRGGSLKEVDKILQLNVSIVTLNAGIDFLV